MGREIMRVPLDYDFPVGYSCADAEYWKHVAACPSTPRLARLLFAACSGPLDAALLADALSGARLFELGRARGPRAFQRSADRDPNPLLVEEPYGEHDECEYPWWRDSVPKGDGWQLWQTVSDGPLSPVFATPDALIDWMCAPDPSGESDRFSPWAQGWERDVAERFVRKQASIPSMIVQGGRPLDARETVAFVTGETK